MPLRLRLLGLGLVALLASTGCFVFDELDHGKEIMDSHSPKKNAQAGSETAAAKPAAANQEGTPQEREKKWWASATSLSSADQAPKEDPHVRCKIEKKERFMLRSDCLSQGGKLL
jgi:hypothetical protein